MAVIKGSTIVFQILTILIIIHKALIFSISLNILTSRNARAFSTIGSGPV